ncbi:hypothetical protein [Prevotella pallens]|jgi:hypothetical protein|uniref:hypothetical protein n=1 Tax=Prevotella pallens TaxID=60133 RepID=UPI001CAFDDD6|nr:hypothetical protein [Prevotella pallens]MBF1509581.1 hypothetical protein [Prevotella pallens]MBF1511812.1 hypothetical protein [Prevotella pallens]MBF1516917.1 hypothetical protein [Prevotella pallens]MBF1519891.1 hypothetical protein [Prevotella pallens]
MKKKTKSLKAYEKPECNVIRIATEYVFCTSVRPDASNSSEAEDNTQWEIGVGRNNGEFEV